MPELPEVETVVRGLEKIILGKTISTVKIYSPKIHKDSYPGWEDDLIGGKFIGIGRRGKNILIDLDNNKTIWVHLKMTGHFYYLPSSQPIDKHDLMVISLKNDKNSLRFNDYRRFGRVRLFSSDKIMNQKGLVDLGPEPLEISGQDFINLFRKSSRMTKPALLDQTFLAGLGNIYSDESLFAAGIHPRRLTVNISRRKLFSLHKIIQQMLKRAIRLMGTSVDTFAGVNGQPGKYQKYLMVYGREGEPCPKCFGKIRRKRIGSRSAHFCPRCQRI
jgi:formamidopyrimidine-DNA glycosylase